MTAQVGNRVKINLKNPLATIEGVVEACDTYGTVILSEAKETILEEIKKSPEDDEEENNNNNNKKNNGNEPQLLQMVLADRIVSIEVHATKTSGAREIRSVFSDALPRKRLFVSDVDTHLGHAICAKFGEPRDWEIIGTKCSTKATLDQKVPLSVSAVVPSFRADPVAFKKAVLHSDVIVCPLRDDIHDAQAALRILSNTVFENEKVFILVSSVLTWASTAQALKAKQLADEKSEKEELRKQRIENGEDPDEDEEDEDELKNETAEENGEQEPPPVFSDSNDHERVPHARYQHWRLLEQATKFANSESLHTYVLMAGLPYGNGEEALIDLFSAAWHREALPICLPLGKNVIPTIHVRDLATSIYNASNAEEVHPTRYMLAVDGGNNTWSEIVTALHKTMGDPNDEPSLVDTPTGGAHRWFDYFSLDLRLEAQNLSNLISEDEWVAQTGLVENMDKIAKEFRKKKELTPLRIAIVGPPSSGKSSLAKYIAQTYGVEHINIPSIIEYYTNHRQQVYKKLVAHRELKRQEAAKRAAEEDAENAAGGDDGGASAVSGSTSITSSARNQAATAAKNKAAAARRAAAAAGDGDDEEELQEFLDAQDEEEAGGEFEVNFAAKEPPPAPSRLTQDGQDSNYEGTEDGENNSRPPSSRRGGNNNNNNNNTGDDDEEDEEGGGKSKEPVPPEVQEAEDKEEDEDDDEALAQLKDQLRLCNKVLSLKIPADGRFIDHALAVMARYKLIHSAQGKNQGYILDGFPKTTRQAAFTFSAGDENDVAASLPDFDEDGNLPEDVLAPVDPEDEAELSSLMEAVDPEMMLDFAIVLDASDEVIVSRASHCGDAATQDVLARLYRRLAFNQKYNSRGGKPGVSVQSWLRAILTNADNAVARSVAVMELDTDEYWPILGKAALNQVNSFLGIPHVIHPTVKELEDASKHSELNAEQSKKERAEAEEEYRKKKAHSDAERQAINASHSRRLLTSSDEKQAANAVCSIPAQNYLTDYIAAPLAKCVADVARVRPNDSLNVLADALYQYEAPVVKAKEILTGEPQQQRNSQPNTPRRHH